MKNMILKFKSTWMFWNLGLYRKDMNKLIKITNFILLTTGFSILVRFLHFYDFDD